MYSTQLSIMTFGLGLLPLQDLREIKDAIAEEKRGREETQVQIDDSAELIGPFFSISIMRVVCKRMSVEYCIVSMHSNKFMI